MTESLKEILPKIFKDLEKKEVLKKIEGSWRSAVGGKASKHSKVAGFKNGALIVNVDNSMWIYELTLKKEKVLERLRGDGLKEIKDIRFRIGELGEDGKRD